MDSGEVDGFFNTWTSAKIAVLELIKTGEWVILAQLADTPLRDLPFSNVPTIGAITRNEEQRELLRLGRRDSQSIRQNVSNVTGSPAKSRRGAGIGLYANICRSGFYERCGKGKD